MADLDKLNRLLRAADEAGNTEDAKRIAEAIKAERARAVPAQAEGNSGGFIDSLWESGKAAVKSAIPMYEPVRAAMENPKGAAASLSEGITLGHADEGAAALTAALGDPKTGQFFDYSRPFSERYASGVEHQQGEREQFASERPEIAVPFEVGGALATGIGAGKAGLTLMRPGMSTGARTVAGALEGAGYGGTYAAGKAPPGEKSDAAMFGAAGGAATGGTLSFLTGALGQKFGNWISRRSVNKNAPQFTDELKNTASSLYEQAEARGVRLPGSVTQRTAEAARQLAKRLDMTLGDGTRLADYNKAWNIIDKLDDLAGKEITPTQMVSVRGLIDEARKQGGKQGRFGSEIMQLWDDVAERVAPELQQARTMWHAARKAEKLEEIFGPLVDIRSGQYASGGAMNAVKTEARQLARRIVKGLERGWTQDELDMLMDLASPSGGRAALEWVSKWTPRSPFSAAAGGGMTGSLAGAATGSWPVGVAVGAGTAGAGAGARAVAEAMQRSRLNTLMNMTRSGGYLPPSSLPGIGRQNVANALTRAGAGGTGAAMERRRQPVPVR